MELARPAVFLFSYFCGGRQPSNGATVARPAVFLFSYFCGGRISSNGAS